jgi:hypothetical protein
MNPPIDLMMKNVLVTKALSRSPWRRGLFLISLVFVWFALSEYASAQVDMARVLMENQARNNDLQNGRAQQYANEARLRALYSARAPASFNRPQLYQPPVYQRPLATQQFPITATDFKASKARLLPARIVNSTPGLTPEFRAAAIAQNNQFLDNFERLGRKNNVASSYEYMTCVSLEIMNGQPVSTSDAQILVNACNYRLATNPAFIAMPPKNKQMIYETNIIYGGTIAYFYARAIRARNVQTQQQARGQAQATLKLLGIDRP